MKLNEALSLLSLDGVNVETITKKEIMKAFIEPTPVGQSCQRVCARFCLDEEARFDRLSVPGLPPLDTARTNPHLLLIKPMSAIVSHPLI